MRRYLGNLGSMTTRWLNSVLAGNRRGESTSSSVGRKARDGRRTFIVFEAAIDLAFALITGQRHHCENNIEDINQ